MTQRPEWFDKEMLDCRSALIGFAKVLTKKVADAEDLVQLTFLKALRAHEHFERGTQMKAWLFTIMRNEFYSNMRKKGREVEDVDGVMALMVPALPAQDHAYDLKILYGQMEKLHPEQRICLELIGIDRMSYEEVAGLLGIPEGTVKSQVSRARAAMLAVFEGRAEAYRV
jgi:RNA polymerase sigma-70 factor (ECF subfamily)